MDSRHLSLILLTLALTPLLTATACPPTGGYVGAIYSQGLSVGEVMRKLSSSIIANLTKPELGVFVSGQVRLEAVILHLEPKEGGIKAYIVPGKRYTLLLVETDKHLSRGPLIYAQSLLSTILDASKVVVVEESQNNVIPPKPVVKWLELEKGVEIKPETLRCGASSEFKEELKPAVGVIANEIDYSLSFNLLKEALENEGVQVVYLGYGHEALAEASGYKVVFFLGGHKAPKTGPLVTPLIGAEADRIFKEGRVILNRSWGFGGVAFVIAGVDRYATRNAVIAFVKGPWMIMVEGILGLEGETRVMLLGSSGGCGTLLKPELNVEVKGRSILATYSEQRPTPCFRFVIRSYRIEGRTVKVWLDFESTSKFCVECIGIIKGKLLIGPLEPGSYTLCVNGICESFTIPS